MARPTQGINRALGSDHYTPGDANGGLRESDGTLLFQWRRKGFLSRVYAIETGNKEKQFFISPDIQNTYAQHLLFYEENEMFSKGNDIIEERYLSYYLGQ